MKTIIISVLMLFSVAQAQTTMYVDYVKIGTTVNGSVVYDAPIPVNLIVTLGRDVLTINNEAKTKIQLKQIIFEGEKQDWNELTYRGIDQKDRGVIVTFAKFKDTGNRYMIVIYEDLVFAYIITTLSKF